MFIVWPIQSHTLSSSYELIMNLAFFLWMITEYIFKDYIFDHHVSVLSYWWKNESSTGVRRKRKKNIDWVLAQHNENLYRCFEALQYTPISHSSNRKVTEFYKIFRSIALCLSIGKTYPRWRLRPSVSNSLQYTNTTSLLTKNY